MNLKLIFKQSITALRANKARSALSILGIVIGVAAVIIILSLGQGLRGLVTNQIEGFGTDLIEIALKVPGSNQFGTLTSIAQGITVTTLKPADAEELRDKDKFPYIKNVAGLLVGQEWSSYRNKEKRAMLIITDNEYIEIDKMVKIAMGRFFTYDEARNISKTAVLGYGIAQKLFGQDCPVSAKEGDWCGENPLGKRVEIKDQAFEVIGVLEKRGTTFGVDLNDVIILPLETGQKLIMGVDYLMEIDLKVTDEKYFPQAKADIARLLRYRHNISSPDKDDFQITTMEEALSIVNDISLIIDLLLGFLAAISLLVGGVGIMNIMLVSVTERTREIGLRKAIGAKNSSILSQFLVEALIITGLGGVVGTFWGILISLLASWAISYQIDGWPIAISWGSIVIAVGISAVIGLIFGIYPARQASKLDPIRALRYE